MDGPGSSTGSVAGSTSMSPLELTKRSVEDRVLTDYESFEAVADLKLVILVSEVGLQDGLRRTASGG